MLPKQESEEPKLLTYDKEDPQEPEKSAEEEKEEPEQEPESQTEPELEPQPQQTTGDLLVSSILLPDSFMIKTNLVYVFLNPFTFLGFAMHAEPGCRGEPFGYGTRRMQCIGTCHFSSRYMSYRCHC